MGASYGDNQREGNFEGTRDNRNNFKGGRSREGGGFRIRLSDNEMKASRSIQEAFNLRSTVAVLGFAIRTLGQMLEEGKLDELIAEYRSQSSTGNSNRNHFDKNGRKNDFVSNSRAIPKANPFARPAKPESQVLEPKKDIEESKIKTNPNQEEVSEKESSDRNNSNKETTINETNPEEFNNEENITEKTQDSITNNN